MFQTSVLASGSKGNCILVRSQETGIIIDAGISLKRIWTALDDLKIPRSIIKAVIISHEHYDHTRSAGALARSLKIPLMITADTYDYCSHRLGKVHDWLHYFEIGREFMIGDILIHPFRSSHDAADSCNFRLEHDHRSLGIVMDLGYYTKLTVSTLQSINTLILESNHDIQMLMDGPYEPNLKQRIKSEHGHLSNEQAVGLLTQVIHPGLKNLVLAHLSEINNHPELAHKVMNDYLQSIRSDICLIMADQYNHTRLVDI